MRIRNWNISQPIRSYMVCRGADDDDAFTVRYQSKVIESIEVTVEEYHKRKHAASPAPTTTNASASAAAAEIKTTKSSANIPPAHTDTVTGMQLVMSKERTPYLVTVSSDAVVKIWK